MARQDDRIDRIDRFGECVDSLPFYRHFGGCSNSVFRPPDRPSRRIAVVDNREGDGRRLVGDKRSGRPIRVSGCVRSASSRSREGPCRLRRIDKPRLEKSAPAATNGRRPGISCKRSGEKTFAPLVDVRRFSELSIAVWLCSRLDDALLYARSSRSSFLVCLRFRDRATPPPRMSRGGPTTRFDPASLRILISSTARKTWVVTAIRRRCAETILTAGRIAVRAADERTPSSSSPFGASRRASSRRRRTIRATSAHRRRTTVSRDLRAAGPVRGRRARRRFLFSKRSSSKDDISVVRRKLQRHVRTFPITRSSDPRRPSSIRGGRDDRQRAMNHGHSDVRQDP